MFSIRFWLLKIWKCWDSSRRTDPDAPFFLDADRQRAWRYKDALDAFRAGLMRCVSADQAAKYGLHSLRVAGWQTGKQGPKGSALAVVQGGWADGASAGRYDRFHLSDVVALAQFQAGLRDAPPSPAPQDCDDVSDDLPPPGDSDSAGGMLLDRAVAPPDNLNLASRSPQRLGSARPQHRGGFGRSSSANAAPGKAAAPTSRAGASGSRTPTSKPQRSASSVSLASPGPPGPRLPKQTLLEGRVPRKTASVPATAFVAESSTEDSRRLRQGAEVGASRGRGKGRAHGRVVSSRGAHARKQAHGPAAGGP